MRPNDLSVNKSGFATKRPPGAPGRLAELANVEVKEPWRIKRWMLENDLTVARFRRPLMFTTDPETGCRDVPRPWLLTAWVIRGEIRYRLHLAQIWAGALLTRASRALRR